MDKATFKIMKARRGSIFLVFFFLIGCLAGISLVSGESFSVDSELLKVSLYTDSSFNKELTVFSESGGEFTVELLDLQGVRVSDEYFSLGPGGSKKVELIFNSYGASPGVHAGSARISSTGESISVPVVFEVESRDLFFDLIIDTSRSLDVAPGENLVADIKIFDLVSLESNGKLGPVEVEVNYFIYYASDGTLVFSENESLVVERETQLSRTFFIPKNFSEGDYILAAVVRYRNSAGTSSRLFEISKNRGLFRGVLDLRFVILLIIAIAVVFGLAAYFTKITSNREDFIIQLKKQNAEELQSHTNFLLAQENIIASRVNEKADLEAARNEVKQKIQEIKDKQEKRIEKLERLKEKGEVEEMEKNLAEWKKSGYDTTLLEYKLKGLSGKEMKDLVKKWKKR